MLNGNITACCFFKSAICNRALQRAAALGENLSGSEIAGNECYYPSTLPDSIIRMAVPSPQETQVAPVTSVKNVPGMNLFVVS